MAATNDDSDEGNVWLVGIDGSIASHSALAFACQYIDKQNDTLHLVTVLSHPRDQHPHGHYQPESLKGFAHDFASRSGITKLHTHEIVGRPNEVIPKLVNDIKAMNLVVGRRGMSQEKREELGSTSAFLVNNANCNVIVVKFIMFYRFVCIVCKDIINFHIVR